jgi:ERCC4-related helicase
MFQLGERVKIRDRLWTVVGVRQHENALTLRVKGMEEDNRSIEMSFIYPVEEIERLPPTGLKWSVCPPWEWKALHDTYLLGMVYGPNLLSMFNRARVRLENYQLFAVVHAFSLPRQRVLLADDVGLGKTIEAGLILLELLTRRRADRILIVTPASLTDQWRDEEMEKKFALNFEVLDSDRISKLAASLPRGANPWLFFNKIITSIDYAKREDVKRALRDVPWDVVVVDEAHYLSESSSGNKIVRTDRSRFGEFIAERADSLLLLSATPHDGYKTSFYSLVKLLDPFLCSSEEDLDQERVRQLVVRRLKADIRNPDGSRRFRPPIVETIPLKFENPLERELYRKVCKYADGVWREASGKRETQTVGFAMCILKRRLISSPEALRKSLQYRIENASPEPADPYSHRGLVADYLDGVPLTEQQLERVEQTLLGSVLPSEKTEALRDLLESAKKITPEIDSKAKTLLDFLEGKKDEKIIVFTEYIDTQNYLYGYLEERGYRGKIALLNGRMNKSERREAEEKFHRPEIRVLIATDAASEGLNFQSDSACVVHYELPWNPNRLEQRNGRVDRWGQTKVVHIYNLHLTETYESEILDRLKQKIERIRHDLGSTSDILGSFSRFKVDQFLMGNGGLKEDVTDLDERIRRCEQAFDEQLERSQTTLDGWRGTMLLKSNPFGDSEKKKVEEIMRTSKSLLPDFEEVGEFVRLVLEREGGVFRPTNAPSVFEIIVPRSLQESGVESSYPRVTFDREIAVNDKNIEFLTASHPLVQAVMRRIRASIYDSQYSNRMSYRVVDSEEAGILFTFVSRFFDGCGDLLYESLIPVFVSLNGSPIWSDAENFALLRKKGLPVNVLSEFLEREYRPRWEQLLALARSVAAKKQAQSFERIQSNYEAFCVRALEDVNKWEDTLRKDTIKKYSGEAQQTLDRTLVGYRMRYELQQFAQKAEKREKEIEESRSVRCEGPEDLGALLVVPKSLLPESGVVT